MWQNTGEVPMGKMVIIIYQHGSAETIIQKDSKPSVIIVIVLETTTHHTLSKKQSRALKPLEHCEQITSDSDCWSQWSQPAPWLWMSSFRFGLVIRSGWLNASRHYKHRDTASQSFTL